ncbi:MAG: acetyl-CoA carboxylase biotin carboxyl carrier protein [Acidobacteriaceae bacterium]|nr:acetyl-CoA carboxylase biotin carboxyl carrier protein [Acidobacteriaceae bacterium]MBV8522166.1 acetyl-CoA carboxylase biotin carboxyl carrier protein [Acetobacteraceae bacterium]MBV8589555.1 acetyl-CoA carboxylase biotin carboxyl carrier protein [Acetobacteraceae bacterium]
MRAPHTRLRFGAHRNEAANAPRPLARSSFDPDAIRALAEILTDTGLTEIEIADKDSRIRVARNPAAVATPSATIPAIAVPAPAPNTPAPAEPVAEDESTHPGAVLSPMVGVVYLSPEPGAPAYVTVGQPVAAGQTVLLIEAMKTFNQIKAPLAGTVSKILVTSGTPVEYGEVLLIIEP